MYAYIITRKYIENILIKYNKLPEPNGKHIDFELNMNYKNNLLYSKNIYYCNKPCISLFNSKSDNYLNNVDKIIRQFIKIEDIQYIYSFIFNKNYYIVCILLNVD